MGRPLIAPISKEGYQLLHDGTLALAAAEQRGMRIDVGYCETQSIHLGRKIERLEKKLLTDPEVKEWKKIYRGKFNLNSDEQLADVLFKHLGYQSGKKTASGKDSTDKTVLDGIDSPMVKSILELRGMQKAKNTYIDNILKEQVDGVLRPSFNLNTVSTMRSSSSAPNFQNIPIRDPFYGKLIRRAFIPREGFLFGEGDYGGIEVKAAACYHKDPTMLTYIRDLSKDMHRDMAMQCYILSADEWNKNTRYCAKNKFVFPEFYGSYFKQVAIDLWNAIDEMNLETKQGIPLKQHLASKGITCFEEFENHIEAVEEDFWGTRFKVYAEWKKKHYLRYQKQGYVDSLTGFRYSGYMKRNEVINYPVQGAAFHCLLKSLIEVTRIAKKEKWKSGPIGQIHDSMVNEIHKDEYNHVLDTIHWVMCEWVPKQWPWIIVPLEVEIEMADFGKSWFEKGVIQKCQPCRICKADWMKFKNYENSKQGYWKCPVCGESSDLPF